MTTPAARTLILYDGVCALCNGAVRFLLRRDRDRRFLFAPLQGATAARVLERHGLTDDLDTIVLVRDLGTKEEGVRVRSDAVLEALRIVGGPWKALTALRVVPRAIRDGLYRWVAAKRYRWFGEYETCPLPAPEDRERFRE